MVRMCCSFWAWSQTLLNLTESAPTIHLSLKFFLPLIFSMNLLHASHFFRITTFFSLLFHTITIQPRHRLVPTIQITLPLWNVASLRQHFFAVELPTVLLLTSLHDRQCKNQFNSAHIIFSGHGYCACVKTVAQINKMHRN